MSKWWIERKQLKSQNYGIYPSISLSELYFYVVALLKKLFREKDATHFKEAKFSSWVCHVFIPFWHHLCW